VFSGGAIASSLNFHAQIIAQVFPEGPKPFFNRVGFLPLVTRYSGGIVSSHESCDVLSLLLAGPPLLVRVNHAHADAHEVCFFDAPL
jgi:hypothetical protein